MNKIVFMLCVCFSLYAQSNFECISIGAECSTGAALQAFKLRSFACPFDWVISSFPAMRSAIADNFSDYLNPQYFKIRKDNHGVINKYGIVFVHDFPTIHYTGNNIENVDAISESILAPDWIKSLPFIQDKYARRINRFTEQCNSENKI